MVHKGKDILTLPNILTLYRLFLAPILYLTLLEEMYGLSLFVFLLSGISDIADGYLARRFDEVSDLGKILDPIADKVTYILALLGLISRHTTLTILLIALCIKEGLCAITSLIAIRHSAHIRGARIHGKIAGAVLWSTVFLHLLLPDISHTFSIVTLSLSLVTLSVSFVCYLKEHLSTIPRANRNIVEDFIRRM